MEKLQIRTITTQEDLNTVLDKIEWYSGVRLSESYAKQGKVVGVFLHNKLAACYMVITSPGFRSLLFVPDSVKKANEFFNNEQYEMMEVNGLWIGPALKTPEQQIRVWMELIKDIFFSKKKYVLLMRDKRNMNMDRFMNMAYPKNLYEGSPLLMAGEKTHKEIQVSFTTRWKILLNVHKYLWELRDRKRRANQFSKQKASIESFEKVSA